MTTFIGTETEYGIATPSDPALSPIVSSTHAVVAYASTTDQSRARWDFAQESPLKDQRGFDLRRYHTVPVIDPRAIGVANVVVDNGARFYVDHAHPEYSSPETSNALDAVLYDAAGDVILREAVAAVREHTEAGHSILQGHDPCPDVKIYKNNVDGKGASYGSHENYLYSRDVGFEELAAALTPFFVARQVLCGAGRVGLGQESEEVTGVDPETGEERPWFQISQRADYIETTMSLETTLNRGIINTRDESHTSAGFARLHVINGDATLSHTSTLLKVGTTALVIDAISRGVDFSDLQLAHPVAAFHTVSRDLTVSTPYQLVDGRSLTAIGLLREYAARVEASTAAESQVMDTWTTVMDLLERDPLSTSHLIDWTAKLALCRGFVARGVSWTDPKLQAIDIQYSDIDPRHSLYHALVRKGRMTTLFTDQEIARAAHTPPTDTRAYFRGLLMHNYGHYVTRVNWDTAVVAPDTGDTEFTVRFADLASFTAAQLGDLFSRGLPVGEFLAELERHGTVSPA